MADFLTDRARERYPWYPLGRIFSVAPGPDGMTVKLFDGTRVRIPSDVAELSNRYVSWNKWSMQTRLNKAAEVLASARKDLL